MKFSAKQMPLIPACWACLFDVAVTIVHQAPEYWKGNLIAVNEGNPIGNAFMKSNVSGIYIITTIWLAIISLAFRFLPQKVGKVFLLFVVIAHSWGAATWISPRYGFWPTIGLFVTNSIIYILF